MGKKKKKNNKQAKNLSSEEKANVCIEKILNTFKKYNLTVEEIILIYSNVGYSIGASLEGYKDKGPSPEKVQRKIYEDRTIGYALMAQSLMMNGEWLPHLEQDQVGDEIPTISMTSKEKKENA